MKNNVFLNKILLILSIVLLFGFVFINNNIFAAETGKQITANNITFTIPSNIDNYIIAQRYPYDDVEYYVLLYSDYGSYWKVSQYRDDYFGVQCFSDENFTHEVSYTRIFTNRVERDFTNPTTSRSGQGDFSIYYDVNYSTVDIYNTDRTSIFFQKTPVVVETPEVEIPALETVEQIPEAMKETMKIVIPVGLAILGIGLVVYLIKFLKSQML